MLRAVKRIRTVEEELQSFLDHGHILPCHVAIIMDGNGRWAKRRALPRSAGHRTGVKSVREIVKAAGKLSIDYLTLYTFSKENWCRPKDEVSMLMQLLALSLRNEISELDKNNVRFRAIGDIKDLPLFAQEQLLEAQELTASNDGLNLNLALSYGARAEIVSAVKAIAQQVKDGKLYLEEIDSNLFSDYLYTKDIPDPDLLIRTGGEQRISNFLLWQLAYSEIYITETYWPDFRKPDLYKALINYMRRERRYGMVSEQLVK